MCGRLHVKSDPLNRQVSERFGIRFETDTNTDLRPTQTVATLAAAAGEIEQLDTEWGIEPSWANRRLINAQAETVHIKKTFKKAFEEHRCLVPCTGFFEWRDEGGARKQKYQFTGAEGEPLYMAAIWYPEDPPKLVTLTMDVPEEFAQYHHRFPVFVRPEDAKTWISGDPDHARECMCARGGQGIEVEQA